MEVLDKLNQSSAATAATLTAVRQAQEASLTSQKNTLDNIMAMNDAYWERHGLVLATVTRQRMQSIPHLYTPD